MFTSRGRASARRLPPGVWSQRGLLDEDARAPQAPAWAAVSRRPGCTARFIGGCGSWA